MVMQFDSPYKVLRKMKTMHLFSFSEEQNSDFIHIYPFRDNVGDLPGNGGLLFQVPLEIFSIWKGMMVLCYRY